MRQHGQRGNSARGRWRARAAPLSMTLTLAVGLWLTASAQAAGVPRRSSLRPSGSCGCIFAG